MLRSMRGGGGIRRGRGCGIAALAAVALLLPGCVGSGAPAPATTAQETADPSALPADVVVEFVQQRSDVAAREAQVRFRNGGADELVVGALEVNDPRFAAPATRVVDRTSVVRPGGAVDVRIQLPAMECSADHVGTSTLAMRIERDGETEVAMAEMLEPIPFLADLHRRDCLVEALTEVATLSFTDFVPSAPGEPAELVLEIVPTGEGAGSVIGIRTTNLLTFGPGVTDDTFALDIEFGAGTTDPIAVRLPLVPLRCDAHAVQEDKRGTIFTTPIALDDQTGEIELAAPPEMRGRILAWVADWCGFGA